MDTQTQSFKDSVKNRRGFEYDEIANLLRSIGTGSQISESVYDIAWLTRLSEFDQQMAEQAINWLRNHQLEDGSWGAQTPLYFHDRLICTLGAIIALAKWEDPQDKPRIEHGAAIIEYLQNNLKCDPAGETIGFELIIPGLLTEAKALGLIHDNNIRFLNGLSHVKEMKFANAPKNMISKHTTMAHSVEMVGREGLHLLDINNLQEKNGSIGYSPAATAFYILNINHKDLSALEFLHKTVVAGTAPYVSPIDTFEYGWALWNISLAKSIWEDEYLMGLCKRSLDFLHSNWEPGRGIAACAGLSFIDTDTTSIVYEVLTKFKYSVDLNSILQREGEDYFFCYELEANPSISINIHVLGALREAGLPIYHPSVSKIRKFLDLKKVEKTCWLDKWHVSPYYPTSHAIVTSVGYDNSLVKDATDWIISTQNSDGSWGFYDTPTAEETAYCLQALIMWYKYGFSNPQLAITKGVEWLEKHKDPPYPPLWIGKTLYTPTLVVQSAIYSALMLFSEIEQTLNFE